MFTNVAVVKALESINGHSVLPEIPVKIELSTKE